jgi:hypothetical protein
MAEKFPCQIQSSFVLKVPPLISPRKSNNYPILLLLLLLLLQQKKSICENLSNGKLIAAAPSEKMQKESDEKFTMWEKYLCKSNGVLFSCRTSQTHP